MQLAEVAAEVVASVGEEVDEDGAAAGLGDAGHLGEDGGRIIDVSEDEDQEGGIDGSGVDGDGGEVAAAEIDVAGSVRAVGVGAVGVGAVGVGAVGVGAVGVGAVGAIGLLLAVGAVA